MTRLFARGISLPEHFIASGSRGPHIKSEKASIYDLPQEQFIVELRKLQGTPVQVLENKELMEMYLPMLRVDFGLAHEYSYSNDSQTKYSCNLSVFGGMRDLSVNKDALQSWSTHFSSKGDISLFTGSHFFINECREMVVEKVKNIVIRYV